MEKENEETMMKIKKSTLVRLRKFAIHKREPHQEVIMRLINFYESKKKD